MSDVSRVLYDEALAEIGKYQRPVAFKLECLIDIEGFIIRPYRVVNLDVTRMFQANYADETVIEMALSEGDYTRYVYPQRQKLQIQLTKIYIGEVEEVELKGMEPVVRRFSAILQDTSNMDLQGLPSTDGDSTLVTIQLQLLEFVPEQLRLRSIGSGFHNDKPSDVLKTLFGIYSKQLKLPKESAVRGMHLWPMDNDEPREHILIPDGTEILDLPGYIQRRCGGLYNSGIGLYYHANMWFIYPLMDETRYEKDQYVLEVFIVPPNRLPESDRTYRPVDGRLQILSTGGSNQVDSSDLDHLRFGNGVIFGSAKKFFNEYVKTSANAPVADSSLTTSRFVIEKRDNPLQYTPWSSTRFTDNIAYEMSKLINRSTQTISFSWDNARSELLYPGMPVKLYYGKETGSHAIYGTLAAVREHTKPNQPGMVTQRYKTSCMLSAVFPSE